MIQIVSRSEREYYLKTNRKRGQIVPVETQARGLFPLSSELVSREPSVVFEIIEKSFGEVYEIPGGKIDASEYELIYSAILRETEEEIGIKCHNAVPIFVGEDRRSRQITNKNIMIHSKIHFFLGDLERDLSEEELKSSKFFPESAETVKFEYHNLRSLQEAQDKGAIVYPATLNALRYLESVNYQKRSIIEKNLRSTEGQKLCSELLNAIGFNDMCPLLRVHSMPIRNRPSEYSLIFETDHMWFMDSIKIIGKDIDEEIKQRIGKKGYSQYLRNLITQMGQSYQS